MKYSSRLSIDVTDNEVVLKAFYGDAINTTIKIPHNDAILLGHKMIKNVVVVEDAISRASSIKGRYVSTSVSMQYNMSKKAIFIECFDDNGEVPMKYRINMSKNEYKDTITKLVYDIMEKNEVINNKLYIVYNSKSFPDEDFVSKLITDKADMVFSKCFTDALKKSNKNKLSDIKIRNVCSKDKQELVEQLTKIA